MGRHHRHAPFSWGERGAFSSVVRPGELPAAWRYATRREFPAVRRPTGTVGTFRTPGRSVLELASPLFSPSTRGARWRGERRSRLVRPNESRAIPPARRRRGVNTAALPVPGFCDDAHGGSELSFEIGGDLARWGTAPGLGALAGLPPRRLATRPTGWSSSLSSEAAKLEIWTPPSPGPR